MGMLRDFVPFRRWRLGRNKAEDEGYVPENYFKPAQQQEQDTKKEEVQAQYTTDALAAPEEAEAAPTKQEKTQSKSEGKGRRFTGLVGGVVAARSKVLANKNNSAQRQQPARRFTGIGISFTAC